MIQDRERERMIQERGHKIQDRNDDSSIFFFYFFFFFFFFFFNFYFIFFLFFFFNCKTKKQESLERSFKTGTKPGTMIQDRERERMIQERGHKIQDRNDDSSLI